MDVTIHASFLPHDDPEAALAFYRDTLGFEVRQDVGYKGMRWITVGAPDQPGTSIVLHPPAADPGITEDERRTITEKLRHRPAILAVVAAQHANHPIGLDRTSRRVRRRGPQPSEDTRR